MEGTLGQAKKCVHTHVMEHAAQPLQQCGFFADPENVQRSGFYKRVVRTQAQRIAIDIRCIEDPTSVHSQVLEHTDNMQQKPVPTSVVKRLPQHA